MAITLTTTLSSEVANSYVDVAYCDDYWSNHYSTSLQDQWSALTTGQKSLLLVRACRILETLRFTAPTERVGLFEYKYNKNTRLVTSVPNDVVPTKAEYLQALQFPRSIDTNSTGAKFIPEPVKMAQCEQAVYMLSFDESVLASRLQGVLSESVSAGSVSVDQQMAGSGTALSPMAYEFVKPFLLKASATIGRG